MSHDLHAHKLQRVHLSEVRPTQFTVGEDEVRRKRREWAGEGRRERKRLLAEHIFPAVRGPRLRPYIVDHHHFGLALLREGVEEVSLAILDDLSWLETDTFWRVMEFRAWTHPYDARGQRREYREMPRRLDQLEDDPYRSLAARVRDAGGYAKSLAPFAEFQWADYFRAHVSARRLRSPGPALLRHAVALARAAEARYLPGWAGTTP